jgi:hypothetical protein
MATDKFGEWEVIARKTNKPIRHLLGLFLNMLLISEPFTWSSMTWTVRHAGRGEIRKVTAGSESEAANRIAAGVFDSVD